jgi:hypothetical protein
MTITFMWQTPSVYTPSISPGAHRFFSEPTGECGFGACADDPIVYELLKRAA